ncbi:hypothetical protein H8959_012058 [Pygathrix nigripes]
MGEPQAGGGGGEGGALGPVPGPEVNRIGCLAPLPSQPGGSRNDIKQVCGKPKVVGKIYGGRDAAAGQWPWQASLLYRGSHLCGAVLIDSCWLVSTAHCFLKSSSSFILNSGREFPGPYVCLFNPDMPESIGSVCADRLFSVYHALEGKVGLIENTLCNTLNGQRAGKGETYAVHEEMLCGGYFSTGKSICKEAPRPSEELKLQLVSTAPGSKGFSEVEEQRSWGMEEGVSTRLPVETGKGKWLVHKVIEQD